MAADVFGGGLVLTLADLAFGSEARAVEQITARSGQVLDVWNRVGQAEAVFGFRGLFEPDTTEVFGCGRVLVVATAQSRGVIIGAGGELDSAVRFGVEQAVEVERYVQRVGRTG